MFASALPREKTSEICVKLCKKKREKNIPNIIDRNVKHDYQISIIFGVRIFNPTGY